MPFAVEHEVRFALACGPGADGRWRGWFRVEVAAEALWRLGLHPGQPSAAVDGPSPPGWWHAAGERYALTRHVS
ncbi:hypothetical protein OHT57_35045 [Streptomyces sp. NBC_00285]|uniref:hypothetical protein n=1 Tax=Streptomyces sp. NBC_00285 TaxID=2975700 RepID=UPI002E28E790|nr:hypothetical protein [Streptomyces sp. NBC_00285]